MFLKKLTNKSTESYLDKLKQLKTALDEADAVVIGAGSGLSAAAGFTYSGERFERYFHDFAEKYHIRDIYSGGFYPFQSLEEYWAWWSRHIWVNRYMSAPKPVYHDLLTLVQDKDYFVLTTNVDHCFQKAGFDKHRMFYTQGDYGLLQCSVPCHNNTYSCFGIIQNFMAGKLNTTCTTMLITLASVGASPVKIKPLQSHMTTKFVLVAQFDKILNRINSHKFGCLSIQPWYCSVFPLNR